MINIFMEISAWAVHGYGRSRKRCSVINSVYHADGGDMPLPTEDSRGSITVEAAIIVPFIFIVLIVVILTFLLMYQQALLTQTASMAAKQAAENWMETGMSLGREEPAKKDKLSVGDLYSGFLSIFDSGFEYSEVLKKAQEADIPQGTQEERIRDIRALVISRMRTAVIKADLTKMNIRFSNGIMQKKLVVELTQNFKLPMGKLISLFTGSESIELTACGTAVIEQPAEYIRNVDLVLEYMDRFGPKLELDGIFDSLKEKILGRFSK